MITVEPLRPSHAKDLFEILENLRPADQHEFWEAGIEQLEDVLPTLDASSSRFIFHSDGRPVFVCGVVEYRGIAVLWGFGTAETKRIIRYLTKWVHSWWLPALFSEGVRRIEVKVPITSQASIEWLMSLGMQVECWHVHSITRSGDPAVQLAYTEREHYSCASSSHEAEQPPHQLRLQ